MRCKAARSFKFHSSEDVLKHFEGKTSIKSTTPAVVSNAIQKKFAKQCLCAPPPAETSKPDHTSGKFVAAYRAMAGENNRGGGY